MLKWVAREGELQEQNKTLVVRRTKLKKRLLSEYMLETRLKSLHFILAQSGNSIIATARPLKSSQKEHN